MATVAEIEQQIAALRARLGSLEDAKITVQAEIERLQFQAVDLKSAARRQREGGDIAGADALRAQAQALDDRAAGLYNSQAFRDVDTAESEIRRLENELYNAQQKAKFEESQQTQKPATEERTAEQKAESDKTTPVVDKPAPVQAEGADNKNPPPTADRPSQTEQQIANDDDPQNLVKSTTKQQANVQGNIDVSGDITPQSNILDNFASNTWTASVYLLSPAQYTELVTTKKKRVNGYNLLFQSGGAPNNVGGYQGASNPAFQAKTDAEGGNQGVAPGIPGSNAPDAGRNPAFAQDFYIDSVTFENLLPGKQTQAAHNIVSLKFTVIEPGNITLLDRIHAAVQDMAQTLGETDTVNYTAAQYLMVMRWYGYDINGNLVAGKTAPDVNGISDTNAIVEKFFPFQIYKVDWSVTSKLVNYEFECVPTGHMVAGSTKRGTIPYDVQLTAQTVEELLSGNAVYENKAAPADNPGATTTPKSTAGQNTRDANRETASLAARYPPPKTNTAPTPKIISKSGLAAAMTEYSAQYVLDGKIKVADTYEIIFADGAEDIKNATIILPGSIVDQKQTSMSNTGNPNQTLNPNTDSIKITTRNWSITAGMQMSQVIELAIRNSSYIYNQGLTVNLESSDKEQANLKASGKPVQWYKINFQAVPIGYDSRTRDFAYHVIYIISKYEIPNFDSLYFPIGKFRGVHKRYPYWFTGLNTAIIDFSANFNAAYNMTISGGPDVESADAAIRARLSSNTRDLIKYSVASRSTESSKGAEGRGNEAGANASEYLYAMDQPGGSTVKIIGDPAWIQQGSLCGGITAQDLSVSAFLPDGTINFDNMQVLFEVVWQRPEDYDLNTGLADPYARQNRQNGTPGEPIQTNVYQATKVLNEFRGGKFEQTITGLLYMIPIPESKKADLRDLEAGVSRGTRPTTAQPEDDSVNRAENAKFARQGNRSSVPISGSAVVTGDGTAVVTPQIPAVQSAMNQASAAFSGTGTPIAPIFSNPNYSAAAISGTSFTAAGITPADTIASVGYPRAPTGAGVNPITFTDAPLPLNTTLQNVRQRIQQIAKDS